MSGAQWGDLSKAKLIQGLTHIWNTMHEPSTITVWQQLFRVSEWLDGEQSEGEVSLRVIDCKIIHFLKMSSDFFL